MANNSINIKTPRGRVISGAAQGDRTTVRLDWNPTLGAQRTAAFSRAQQFVDAEVLRLSSPYMPLRTGMLIKLGQLGTVIGTGEVNWVAPYANRQYYETAMSRPYDAQRGAYWFERMKVDHKDEIVAGARKVVVGGNG